MIITEHVPSADTLAQHALDMDLEQPSVERWRRDVAVINTLQSCGEIDGYLKLSGWRMVPRWAIAPYVCSPVDAPAPWPSPAQSRDVRDLHPVLREFVAEVKRRWSHAFVVETGRKLERQQWLFGQGRTLSTALVEFSGNTRMQEQIRQIPGGCWDPRARIVTRTVYSRHLFQPDGTAHAVDIGLLNGRKGLEQDSRKYDSFVQEALLILQHMACSHGGLVASNGGPQDRLHWQLER